ncbi:MAG: hypothetical protein K2W96_17605 [Gemmataceae bacterium]|nr:hypothetical protein [Gemmataceae bacterium]
MPDEARRQLGGLSNKRGNRYEDHFIVARMIEHAPAALNGALVRLKEQAGCPVDDLLLLEPGAQHFHQLKSGQETTWGADGEKIANEFRSQRAQCEASGWASRLYLVVSDEHRASLLRSKVPVDLATAVEVVFFPQVQRPSALADLPSLAEAFSRLHASRFPSRTNDERLAGAMLLALAEHAPDGEGFCVLILALAFIRERSLADLRSSIPVAHPDWSKAEAALDRIPGLRWWTDRGHLEWECGPDRGMVGPVDGDRFKRFVARIATNPPTSFAEFEEALP